MNRPIPHRCDRYHAAVSLELDGDLSQLEHAFLKTHGARCAACRRFRVDVRAITHDLRAAPLEVPLRAVSVAHRPMVHTRRLRGRIAVGQATALAASLLVVSFGALYAADLGVHGQSSAPARSVPRLAYLDSPEYELSLLRPVEVPSASSRVLRF
jgi:predicted anti-sigma-YlaC factor YlaD